MAADYIPVRDADFQVWADNYSAMITAAPTDYGLVTGEATTLAGLTTTFDDALSAALNGSTRGPMTVAAKDTARANLEAYARQLAMKVQTTPTVTNEQKAALRITVRKTGRTPVPTPNTHPVIAIMTVSNKQQVLRYSDETTPNSRKKPFGAIALMLDWWITAVGTSPSGPPFASLPFTSNPIVINFQPGDVLKTATYQSRWVTGTGLFGPYSNTVSGTIVGSTTGG